VETLVACSFPVSWHMAPVIVHVRPGGWEEHQQIDFWMIFGGMWTMSASELLLLMDGQSCRRRLR